MNQQKLRSRIAWTISDAILECCDRGEDLNGMIILMHQSILNQFDPPLTEIVGAKVFSGGYMMPYDLMVAFSNPTRRQVKLIKEITENYDNRAWLLVHD